MTAGTDFVVEGAVDLEVKSVVNSRGFRKGSANLVLFCPKDRGKVVCHDC
jgi:hypothetical protein